MKKLISIILVSLMILSSFSTLTVLTNQSCYNGFDRNYTLTGDPASDMVAIATRQIGRTQSQFGYTEGWCDNFVSMAIFGLMVIVR